MRGTMKIQPHMSVVGIDGGHVGTVDRLEGDRIKLTKEDDPDGTGQHHHYLPRSAVQSVQGNIVRLSLTSSRAREMAISGGQTAGQRTQQATAESLASTVQEKAGEAFDQARTRVEGAARRARNWADEAYGQGSTMARDAAHTVSRQIEAQPMVAALVAGAIGFALGVIAASARR